jgi:hypothetical protein
MARCPLLQAVALLGPTVSPCAARPSVRPHPGLLLGLLDLPAQPRRAPRCLRHVALLDRKAGNLPQPNRDCRTRRPVLDRVTPPLLSIRKRELAVYYLLKMSNLCLADISLIFHERFAPSTLKRTLADGPNTAYTLQPTLGGERMPMFDLAALQVFLAALTLILAILVWVFTDASFTKRLVLSMVFATCSVIMLLMFVPRMQEDDGSSTSGTTAEATENTATVQRTDDVINDLSVVPVDPDVDRRVLDLDRWCHDYSHGEARLIAPVQSPGAAHAWHCADGTPISMQAVCEYEYPSSNSVAVALNEDDAYSWRCRPQ